MLFVASCSTMMLLHGSPAPQGQGLCSCVLYCDWQANQTHTSHWAWRSLLIGWPGESGEHRMWTVCLLSVLVLCSVRPYDLCFLLGGIATSPELLVTNSCASCSVSSLWPVNITSIARCLAKTRIKRQLTSIVPCLISYCSWVIIAVILAVIMIAFFVIHAHARRIVHDSLANNTHTFMKGQSVLPRSLKRLPLGLYRTIFLQYCINLQYLWACGAVMVISWYDSEVCPYLLTPCTVRFFSCRFVLQPREGAHQQWAWPSHPAVYRGGTHSINTVTV